GHARHLGSSKQRRLPDFLARPWLRTVRRQPAGPEGVHQREGRAELPARSGGVHDIPPPHSHPQRGRHAGADRDILPGLHAVTSPLTPFPWSPHPLSPSPFRRGGTSCVPPLPKGEGVRGVRTGQRDREGGWPADNEKLVTDKIATGMSVPCG